MPETSGHCQHSCSNLSATNKLEPSRLHYCPPITWQGLKHTYKPATACAESPMQRAVGGKNQTALSRLTAFGKMWISHALAPTCNAVLTSAVCEDFNPAVVQKKTWLWSMRTKEWGGRLPVELIVVFLCTSITMWIEFSCSSGVPQMFCLNSSSTVCGACELKKVIQQPASNFFFTVYFQSISFLFLNIQ